MPKHWRSKKFNIMDEVTQFNFSEDSESWWIPAYAYRRYEFLYANTLISEINRDKFSELVEHLHDPRIGPEAVQTHSLSSVKMELLSQSMKQILQTIQA